MGWVGLNLALYNLQCFLLQFEGVVKTVNHRVIEGQVVSTAERFGMVGAKIRRQTLDRFYVERESVFGSVHLTVTAGQVAHSRERFQVVQTQLRFANGQDLLAEFKTTQKPALVGVDRSQVLQGLDGGLVFGPELGRSHRERLLKQLERLGKSAERAKAAGQII